MKWFADFIEFFDEFVDFFDDACRGVLMVENAREDRKFSIVELRSASFVEKVFCDRLEDFRNGG